MPGARGKEERGGQHGRRRSGRHGWSVQGQQRRAGKEATDSAIGSPHCSPDPATGVVRWEVQGQKDGYLSEVAISPDGRLATGGWDRAVILWDARTGEGEHRMQGDTGVVACVSFSADGTRLASGSEDRSICVWDVATGAFLRKISDAHFDFVARVTVSPTDRRRLVSAGGTDQASKHGCQAVVFPPDGRTIATSVTVDGFESVDIWDVDSEDPSNLLSLHGDDDEVSGVSSLAFSDDGSKIAVGSWNGNCKVWGSSPVSSEQTRLIPTITVGRPVISLAWGRDWVRDTQRGAAFAMGHHPRLGGASRAQGLDAGVICMILDLSTSNP
ncbi:WD40-repeat-containing domain protein [Baffinella frigidus]|nr:WD40-repeat-containing domain protein [Cryptophyta sp. CCMP2293]